MSMEEYYLKYIEKYTEKMNDTLNEVNQELKGLFNERSNGSTNQKLDLLIDAMNRQARATESLVTLMTKIEDNTNPNPKINAPSKRVDMNR